MVIANKHLVPKGFKGITLYPFIILKSEELKRDEVLINHERIHLRQQLELLIIFFYIWYGIEYLYNLYWSGDKMTAYKLISFEVEANTNEHNLPYLEDRKYWGFLKY